MLTVPQLLIFVLCSYPSRMNLFSHLILCSFFGMMYEDIELMVGQGWKMRMDWGAGRSRCLDCIKFCSIFKEASWSSFVAQQLSGLVPENCIIDLATQVWDSARKHLVFFLYSYYKFSRHHKNFTLTENSKNQTKMSLNFPLTSHTPIPARGIASIEKLHYKRH